MRYLMANRQADGAWGSTYSTAWTVMAVPSTCAPRVSWQVILPTLRS